MENDILTNKPKDVDHLHLKKSQKDSAKKLIFWPNILAWGIVAGLGMGAYILLLHAIGAVDIIALKFMKYLVLAGILGTVLSKYRKLNSTATFFQNGISIGSVISFTSAITFLLVNFVVTILTPALSFTKFGKTVDTPFDFLVISGGTFFEILVFGLIGTFIWIQILKRRADRDIDKIKS